ncbi:MAG TPA: hypothetical protein VF614_03000 [Chthoniobacteraceae bacterium]|jgi:hypothetical protein
MNKSALFNAALVLASSLANAADPALTIYNQNFAVVRDTVPLELRAGGNDVSFSGTTAHLEPSSVILRDPAGQIKLQILEQNYRNDPVSPELLLSLFEGQTIKFTIREPMKPDQTVSGKIIRSGYAAHSQQAMQRYGQAYAATQMARAYNPQSGAQPIIEVDGQIQFGLPGTPIFPSLGDDTILKPMLSWKLAAAEPAKLNAELTYVTGGMSWEADYNIVAPEKGEVLGIVGWVTMDNQSGKSFPNAAIQLMAGDVSKLQPGANAGGRMDSRSEVSRSAATKPVTEKAFDEYHLYTLERSTTLHDRETKQVEFVRAEGVGSERIYVYDGLTIDWSRWNSNRDGLRRNEEFGTDSNTKVAVMRQFKNTAANGLGIPLPKGRVRLYRRDGAQLQFIGENTIDHTPKDELVKVYTGNAFDLVGERRRTAFKTDSSRNWTNETFEIKLRNHKAEAVEIRVVEHLYRWVNWEITEKSNPYLKTNAQEIQFRIQLAPDEEKTVTYKVHYSW